MAGFAESTFGEFPVGGDDPPPPPGVVIGGTATEVDTVFPGTVVQVAPNYQAAVLLDHPLIYLHVGEASGATTAVDSSGNGRDGTRSQGAFGAASIVPTRTDTAYTGPTAGTTGIGVAYASWMNVSSISLEAWIKTGSATAQGIWCRDAQSTTRSWQAGVNSSGKVFFTVIAGVNPTINSIASVNNNVKHHIVITYDGTTAKIYIDGALDNTATLSQALPVPTVTGLTFGNSNRTTTARFTGTIDEIAIYGSVLSPTRVLAHYTSGIVTVVVGGQAIETDEVIPGTVVQTTIAGRVSSAEVVRSGTIVQTVTGGTRVAESDAVRTGTVLIGRADRSGVRIASAEAVRQGLIVQTRIGGRVTSTETVRTGSIDQGSQEIEGGRATVSEAARTGTIILGNLIKPGVRVFSAGVVRTGTITQQSSSRIHMEICQSGSLQRVRVGRRAGDEIEWLTAAL